jgi:hypothetical protein
MRVANVRVLLAALGACVGASAWAQAAPPQPLIYTCVNAAGKKLTSDRLIPECNDREQRVLNSDGSVRKTIGPTLTAEERIKVEDQEKSIERARIEKAEAVRADKNLLNRFPNEAAHAKARAKALDNVKGSLKVSEDRLAALAKERKPLTDDAEFYVGKPLPAKLKAQLEANDTAVEAQRVLVQNQKLEAVRIDQNFDTELERLKKLWGGASPGSLGVLPVASAPVVAKAPASAPAVKK